MTTNTQLDPKDVVTEFDKRATQRKGVVKVLSDRFGLETNENFDEECSWFIRQNFPDKIKNILDVGIGIGRLARLFSDKCDEIVGVDFSNNMLDVANDYLDNKKNIALIHNDILDLNFLPKYFSLGIASLVLKHNNDERAVRVIKKLKKWCKQILLIEHVAGGATGSKIAIVRTETWYINQFKPMKPVVLCRIKRSQDNIILAIFK